MKTKMFKSALSLLLVLLLCCSVVTPAVSAATVTAAAVSEDSAPVVSLHATGGDPLQATVGKADVKKVFDDLALGEGDYYGIKQKTAAGSPTDLSGESDSTSVSAGEYTVYRTAATTEEPDNAPDWEAGSSQDVTVRLYYTASFAVSGCDDGAILLNDNAVTGSVELYTDTEYTVTAQQVDNYTCQISGATNGEAFTPASDMAVTAEYSLSPCATFTVNTTGEGTVKIMVNGAEVKDYIPAGASFEVDAQPNTDRGYTPGSVVVKKNGTEVEGTVFGPVEDGEEYEVDAAFTFAPEEVDYEVNAASPKLKASDFNKMFNESDQRSYGYAPLDDPNNINAINLNNGTNFAAGSYYIYSAPYSRKNPDWTVAKVKKMNLRTFYNGSFTVTGCEDGAVILNGAAVEGDSAKLYTDSEYTITAKQVDEYFSVMTGAENGAAFTPSSEVNVKLAYYKEKHATFSVSVNGEGSAAVKSDGEVTTEFINEGSTFTVEAAPNTTGGYKLDNIVVTKGGEEVEAKEGAYGPVADGESYAITVNFKFDPDEVKYDLHADSKLTSTNVCGLFGDSVLSLLSKSYGYATKENPDQVNKLTTGGTALSAGEYYIFKADGTSNPNWSKARVLKLKLRTYYNGTFTVTGHNDGEVRLNDEAVSGKTKLYTDAEYTVTVTPVEDYEYTVEGATEGEAFTPSKDMNVTVTYRKPAFATITVDAGNGGTATVKSDGFEVTDRVNEGSTFTVEPNPYTGRGYKLDKVTVTKDGEEVEPVDGAYGPVADGESYVITVSFKFEPEEVKYSLHATSGLTSTVVCDIFDDSILNLLTKSYGYASVDTPDQVTKLSTSGTPVEPGEYYVYKADGTSNPNWTTANVLKLKLRTYYSGTFTVSGHEEGEVDLNGEAVTGSKKLFTDETYTVTTKQIEGYICTLYGAEEGVSFTPSADVDVNAVYVKDAYATFTVNSNEGGTVKVLSDGNEMLDKISDGSTFTVEANATSSSGYYVESVAVTKDGEEVEATDGAYGPVAEGESYEITVTFAKATLTLKDGEIKLTDIYYKDYEAIEQSILANATLNPEEFTEKAQTKIEYVAYTLLGFDVYATLGTQSESAHAFGTSDGTLKGGNTEKVRVTMTLPDYGIELRATATMTVSDDRVETAIESSAESFTITYGDDLKAQVMETLTVTLTGDGQPVDFTEDDITLSPEKLNASLTSAQNAQEVTVCYKGTDIYAACETVINVYVNRAPSTLDAISETITYGETPKAEVVTTPEDLDHLKVIAGVDGDVQRFISILVPESVKERMKIRIAGIVVLDIYQMLVSYIGEDGATLDDLKELVTEINELIESSETIKQAIESSGFSMESLENVMSFISKMPNFDPNLRIRLEQLPKNAGTYMLFAVSTDTNYTTSEDIAYIVIKPKSSTDDEAVELRFNSEMQTDGNKRFLSYDEAQEFDFGGKLYVNDQPIETDKVSTLYTGTTARGSFIAQSEPVREAGVYTESVFLSGGNYSASPIIREFTIKSRDSKLMMDDLTVTYDGKAHALEAYFDDGSELTGRVTTIYRGSGYLSNTAPVDAGEYTVYATYAGDSSHKSGTVTAKLTIKKRRAVITVSCKDTFTYGELTNDNLSDAELSYEVSGTVNDDLLGVILPVLNRGESFPNVGKYTATVRFVQNNSNYVVTIRNATLTIVPKQVVVKIDAAQKEAGAEDPEFTYTVTDAEGNVLDAELNIKLAREEGEEPGEYRVYIDEFNETNYTLDEEASTDGVLTINKRTYILGDANGDGVININDSTLIQRHLAKYDPPVAIDLQAADVDGNGKVDITDATILQKYLAGFTPEYPIGEAQA